MGVSSKFIILGEKMNNEQLRTRIKNMDHEQLRQMTFRTLDRVKQLGKEIEMAVFDRGMDEWYDQFLVECSPEQREEIEYHHEMNKFFSDHVYIPPTKK